MKFLPLFFIDERFERQRDHFPHYLFCLCCIGFIVPYGVIV